jgi:hypothetical protein
MDIVDKTNLASAYAAAWLAVKNRPATVTVDPHGWFTVNKGLGTPQRVRASALIKGLAVLTSRMVEARGA